MPASSVNAVRTPRERLLIVAALLAVYVFWGSTYLVIKFGLETLPPFFMAALRFWCAGLVLFAFLRWRGFALPTAKQARNSAIMGTLLLGGGNGFVCYAQQSVSSGLAAVAVASMPLFAALFAGLYGNWPSRRDAIGLAVGFVGIVYLNTGAEFLASPSGAAALIAAPILWAFGSVWSRRQDLPNVWMSTAVQMLAGGAVLTLMSLGAGEDWPARITPGGAAAIAYLAVLGSLVGFTAYVYLLQTVRPALATSYAYVNPPIAIAFGVWLAGEAFTAHEAIATAVILGGVAFILTAKR
ncbi:MAG: drug/metabolite exporter YedA [Pseudomonadota bacterium]